MGRTFRGQRTYDTGKQNHHHCSVQHVVVQKPLSVFHYYFVTYENGCKRCGSLCITQAEHHAAFIGLHAVYLLGCKGGQPFAECGHNGHDYCNLQCSATLEQCVYIYYHAHTYQKIGDEQGVSNKLQPVHQRRHMRHQPVEHKTGQECAENSLHSCKLHKPRTQKYHGQNKDELHYAVGVLLEKPSGDYRECVDYGQGGHHNLACEHKPEKVSGISLVHAAYDCKHDKCKGHGYCRATDRDIYTSEF